MLKITLIVLGKFKEPAFKELEKEYLKRLSPFAKVTIDEIPELGYKGKTDLDQIRQKEAQIIEKHLPKHAMVILVDEKGMLRSSEDFASFFDRISSLGQDLVFVLGSGLGLHSLLKALSNYQISLSPLTFTHNFARVLLEEQLYRAFMINAGRRYHK